MKATPKGVAKPDDVAATRKKRRLAAMKATPKGVAKSDGRGTSESIGQMPQ